MGLIARVPRLSARQRIRLAQELDDGNCDEREALARLRRLGASGLERLAGRRERLAGRRDPSRASAAEEDLWRPEAWATAASRDLAVLDSIGARLISYLDADYPALLRETARPPFALYVRGRLPGGLGPAVAMVGTRYPTGRGLEVAFSLGRGAALEGVDVVSGLARGIDTASHRGALAARRPTFAVLGCGIDSIHPPSNKSLAAAMLRAGGGLASEYPPGTPPSRWTFPERNRILAGLCRSTIVIEAPGASGALITAAFALEEGRDVYVAAECLGGPRSAGSDALAADGAPTPRTFIDIMADWSQASGPSPRFGQRRYQAPFGRFSSRRRRSRPPYRLRQRTAMY